MSHQRSFDVPVDPEAPCSSGSINDWISDAPMPPPEFPYNPATRDNGAAMGGYYNDQRFGPAIDNCSYLPTSSADNYMFMDQSPRVSGYQMTQQPSQISSQLFGSQSQTSTIGEQPSSHVQIKQEIGSLSGEMASVSVAGAPTNNACRDSSEVRPNVVHVFPANSNQTSTSPYIGSSANREEWCQIQYYEFKQRVGQPWFSSSPLICVDGLCSTQNNDRLSLGSIGNGSRAAGVVNVRAQIGKGVSLSFEDGVCYLQCLGESPVFVQCPIQASEMKDDPSTVYRLPGSLQHGPEDGRRLVVFNESHLTDLIIEAQRVGYKNLYALQKMCTARLSFVKGFGKLYRRQSITETPVWIEVFFVKHMQMIDKIMQDMNPVGGAMSSFS